MADRRVSADGIIGLNGKFKGRLKKVFRRPQCKFESGNKKLP